MTREEIARATCDASARLDALKRQYGHDSELFPAASLLRNFRIGGIAKLLGRELVRRIRERVRKRKPGTEHLAEIKRPDEGPALTRRAAFLSEVEGRHPLPQAGEGTEKPGRKSKTG